MKETVVDSSRNECGNTASSLTAGILNLPDELLEMIMTKLPYQDQVKMKRVCRKFLQKVPFICRDPVIQYSAHYDAIAVGRGGGLVRLRSVVKSVTSSATKTLTIVHPSRCHYAINAATIRDLSLRCPSLERLIIKPGRYNLGRLELQAFRALPASVVLELHGKYGIELVEPGFARTVRGIFTGPFENWTSRYLAERLNQPGLYQPLAGEYNHNGPQADGFHGLVLPEEMDLVIDEDDEVIVIQPIHNPAPAFQPYGMDVINS